MFFKGQIMKKIYKKFISLIICLALMITVFQFSITTYAASNNYYVINGGTGDGRTASSPASSVETAIKTINADGLGENDNANIYIMQRSDYQTTPSDKKHYITYWSYDGSLSVNHKAHITIRPYDVTIKTELASTATLGDVNKVIRLGGPTTFKGIRILAMRGYWNRDIYANGNDFTVEKDVTFGDLSASSAVATHCYGFNFGVSHKNGGTYTNLINITYKAPTIGNDGFYLTNYAGGNHTFNEDVNITFNNSGLGKHETIYYPILFYGTAVYKKNLNIYIKAAAKINFSAKDSPSVTANGGVQIISDSSVNFKTRLSDLTCFSEGTKIWDITLTESAKECLEFTRNAGTYKVVKEITVVAENSNGEKVYSDNDGYLTLPQGSWSVFKKPVIHYGDANFDGVINVKDLVSLKKLITANNHYFETSDINDDNLINSADLILLKKHILDVEKIEWEKSAIELAKNPNLSGGADKEASKLKNSILNAPDTIKSTTTTYYVAENGNNENLGTSPDSPITVSKINSLTFKKGDAILFKRGDTFRLSSHLLHRGGISYGAYGSGEKPIISGSLRNYADTSLWSTTDGNLWKLNLSPEAGHIVFDDGETIAVRKTSLDLVKKDGDYYHDMQNGVLYLLLSQRNPGNYFDSIEISTTKWLMFGGNELTPATDIYIENLTFKYASEHAMYLIGTKNCEINNCEYYWIGGAYYDNNGKRLGNAIQFWNYAENCKVSNCYFYEIFDAPLTYQGLNYNKYIDMYFENNLMEYAAMYFEIWGQNPNTATSTSSDPEAILKNTYCTNNIFRFGGYGFGGTQRPDKSEQSFVQMWYTRYEDSQIDNISITDNIFDTANCNFFFIDNTAHQLNISNNTYYQKNGSEHKVVRNATFFSDDQISFEAAVKLVDKNPKSITWLD